MNKLLLAVLTFVVTESCTPEKQDHTKEISQMEDTLFKAFPTVNRISIEVKDDPNAELNITLGDKELYNATEQEREEVTARAAMIAEHVFIPNIPEKGTVTFVSEETTINVDEASKKTYKMRLQESASK